MRLLVFTWPYALFFWIVYVWAFAPELGIIGRRVPASSRQDSHSAALIVFGQSLAIFAAFAIAATVPSASFANRGWFFWIGIVMLVAGSLLRRHCWRMLGAHFTGVVSVTPQQPVVDRGAYRYVRHPSYSAAAIMYLGIGLALANLLSVTILLLVAAAVYGYRITIEERALLSTIGDPYRHYITRTKRFIPFLF